jgi:HAE1 family hydrophobic/amphiphilic exporter-1
VNLPTGTLYGRERATSVTATGQLDDAKAYAPLIVTYRNGAPVRLDQLGRVLDSVQNDKVAAWYNGTRGVVLAIQRQPGTNTIEVVDAIRAMLPAFQVELPPSITLSILYDRSVSIRDSVRDVEFTLILALVLVVGVIFVFLRSVTATLIPSMALPMSLIGTFAAMYAFGYSLDNLSLMALTLSVGFVVDDAIVMLENITRHMEMGAPRMKATLEGAKEIGFTIVSMTLSLAAVFIPVLFMGGILGRLLHEFAVTIIVAVLISGFVSLTLTPLLCSRMLTITHPDEHGRLYRASERAFDAILAVYRRSLAWVLGHRGVTMAVFRRGVRGHRRVLLRDAQGLPAERRRRPAVRHHRGAPGHLVRRDGQPAAAGGRDRAAQSARRERDVVRGRRRTERLAQQRARVRDAEAARGASRADAIVQELRPRCTAFPASSAYVQNIPRSASAAV